MYEKKIVSNPRYSGILVHPTSFPSAFGIGDLGPEAYRFVNFLADSKQQRWQILPLGPPGVGNSPYASYSAFAGNHLMISPELLKEDGLLSESDSVWANYPQDSDSPVNFEEVVPKKMELLRFAFEKFKALGSEDKLQQEFQRFCDRTSWLDDYTLYMSLKEEYGNSQWTDWDANIRKRDPGTIQHLKEKLAEPIYFQKFLQFQFFRQWFRLKSYTNQQGIEIIGDIPIYVAHDSADVWANQSAFALDPETGAAKLMAGVPPDYFSATGQLWGNPVYNWEQLENENYSWWMQRFRATLSYVDLVRIDHFRGFEAYWAVPQGETTAMNGEWIPGPGEAFFEALEAELGKLPIIAEDLGLITRGVSKLRDRFNLPGMKVLQFAFVPSPEVGFIPCNFSTTNCIVYSGTHDNNTTLGWYEDEMTDESRQKLWSYLGKNPDDSNVHWELIRLAFSTIAYQAIVPMQDVLGVRERMNIPGVGEGNWQWRYSSTALTPEIGDRLKVLTEIYNRAPKR